MRCEDLEAVHAGQLEVEEDDHRPHGHVAPGVGTGGEQEIQRLDPVAGDDQRVGDLGVPEGELGELQVVGVVLDEQDRGNVHAAPRVKKKVAPSPGRPSAQMRPPWREITRCAVASPMPVPSNSVASCRRWNAPKSLSA